MQSIDFRSFLEAGSSSPLQAPWADPIEHGYASGDGLLFRGTDPTRRESIDIVRLLDGAYMFATSCSGLSPLIQYQAIPDSDWIHLQFRVDGSGREAIGEAPAIETPANSCMISRYPKGSLVQRSIDGSDNWRVVCLFGTPQAMCTLLDVSMAHLSGDLSWLGAEQIADYKADLLPLADAMSMAVGDIFNSKMTGHSRRIFMKGKALELLSATIQALSTPPSTFSRPVKLSPGDRRNIEWARKIMLDRIGSPLTLAQLSKEVGLNRTKLALGFKTVYGVSVQTFWRDARLQYARDLLLKGEMRVTDVAFEIGYAEMASFTRAFLRKFGFLPSDCRASSPY